MAGNIAGFIAPPTVAYILAATSDNWALTFYISAAVYFIGSAAWFFIDPMTRLDEVRDVEA